MHAHKPVTQEARALLTGSRLEVEFCECGNYMPLSGRARWVRLISPNFSTDEGVRYLCTECRRN